MSAVTDGAPARYRSPGEVANTSFMAIDVLPSNPFPVASGALILSMFAWVGAGILLSHPCSPTPALPPLLSHPCSPTLVRTDGAPKVGHPGRFLPPPHLPKEGKYGPPAFVLNRGPPALLRPRGAVRGAVPAVLRRGRLAARAPVVCPGWRGCAGSRRGSK